MATYSLYIDVYGSYIDRGVAELKCNAPGSARHHFGRPGAQKQTTRIPQRERTYSGTALSPYKVMNLSLSMLVYGIFKAHSGRVGVRTLISDHPVDHGL